MAVAVGQSRASRVARRGLDFFQPHMVHCSMFLLVFRLHVTCQGMGYHPGERGARVVPGQRVGTRSGTLDAKWHARWCSEA